MPSELAADVGCRHPISPKHPTVKSTRTPRSYRTGTQNCISWPLTMPETSVSEPCIGWIIHTHTHIVLNIKRLIRCQHANQIKKSKSKQSTYAISQLHRTEQSRRLRAAEDHSNYVQISHSDRRRWLGLGGRQMNQVYIPSCFGFWLSSEYWPPISCKTSVHRQEGSVVVSASAIRPVLHEVTTQ